MYPNAAALPVYRSMKTVITFIEVNRTPVTTCSSAKHGFEYFVKILCFFFNVKYFNYAAEIMWFNVK